MQATVLAKEFRDTVAELAKVTPKRSTLPILGDLLLEHHGGDETLTVTAGNLETNITRPLSSGGTAGRVTVPAAVLAKMLPAFKERVEIKAEPNQRVSFREGARRITLDGNDPEDYPPTPDGQEHLLTIEAEDLRRALDRVTYCARRDDDRPILHGALLEAGDGTLTLTGADGFKLARQRVPADVTGEGQRVIPLGALVHLRRFLARSTNTFSLALSESTVEITDGHRSRLVAQTVAGIYPNVEPLIPDHSQYVTFARDAFVAELKASAPIADAGSRIARLYIGDGKLRIVVKAEAFGDYEGQIEADCHGEGRVAFNHRYLSELMGQIGETATLRFGASDKAGLWGDEDDGFLCILMPMTAAW